ncbi:PRMT5 arginine-N-methyltransferase-domain-containing protein [Xylariaceae sp. FL0255]|nr:PRMT5 arginine-N-methyltransferase-domain-containing protein [Xylariaceae sp. FL0255]
MAENDSDDGPYAGHPGNGHPGFYRTEGVYQAEFYIAQHDSARVDVLTEPQADKILEAGFGAITLPITNDSFENRVTTLLETSLAQLHNLNTSHPGSRHDPIVPPLTSADTKLYPSPATRRDVLAYVSPWIDLCSANHLVATISRQVLNIEVAHANFCGVRTIIIPGPRRDADCSALGSDGITQYARAVQEALRLSSQMNFVIHLPMYREPWLEEPSIQISADKDRAGAANHVRDNERISLYSCWESWHTIRTICDYDMRLSLSLKVPRLLPEQEVQSRWFSEPLQYLSFHSTTFQKNASGHPSLSRAHQDMILHYMTLKHHPYFLLCDVGPNVDDIPGNPDSQGFSDLNLDIDDDMSDFPTLAEAAASGNAKNPDRNDYVAYLRQIEKRQKSLTMFEKTTLVNFQDWLQSPLQPLSDNLESVTYEVFESDPVKYDQYKEAIKDAIIGFKGRRSSREGIVIAVVGAGRGAIVARVLAASQELLEDVKVYAIEKNPNAYVYLLRQNELHWDNKVTVVKTDMRAWKGPIITPCTSTTPPTYGKVDILVSELLGSFGDNELSPECLDGIQHVINPVGGISIPSSYTAHLSPISTPRIYADLLQRLEVGKDANAFITPWVVRLYQIDYMAKRVPDHDRFQKAWGFHHPVPQATIKAAEARRSGGLAGGGGGSMMGSMGTNDHNARQCRLNFVSKSRGVIHGLGGYFEAVLYGNKELSIRPDTIDKKSANMVSWFPIFFPLKRPLDVPADSELEVSMWRQTDDTKVWYEWLVDVFMWTGRPNGEKVRVRVGGSEMHSSRKVACLM